MIFTEFKSSLVSRTGLNGAKFEYIEIELHTDQYCGRSEVCPVGFQGETCSSTLKELQEIRQLLKTGITRAELNDIFPATAARCALDCAIWDIRRQEKVSSNEYLLDVSYRMALNKTAFPANNISAAATNSMVFLSCAPENASRKLAEFRDLNPQGKVLLDFSEPVPPEDLPEMLAGLSSDGPELICGATSRYTILAEGIAASLDKLCAPAAFCTSSDLQRLGSRFGWIELSLEAAGGFTEARKAALAARSAKFNVLIRSNAASAKGLLPVAALAEFADIVLLENVDTSRDPCPQGLSFDGTAAIVCEA
ncbi:hypothetical protein [Roseibium sediminicola]|uniref:Mandelate racemase/muconate lactonizing enzyme C-terminal domain-containing protein n=1 Tax=Roseibium sediminicola TaxID=2933272 RepID=A0ABT0H217_9HYPH|nr:hypothetical protein [Roseibium sp. CAU 1639]MCK7615719.1 hypothetical protein [Roseibium sp. CAU 1639]